MKCPDCDRLMEKVDQTFSNKEKGNAAIRQCMPSRTVWRRQSIRATFISVVIVRRSGLMTSSMGRSDGGRDEK